ncbi:XrtA system polysaccharide chain length determinant [Opacimonas viscosa]|uniref:Wzz/FepE/Etk N-terminal domain-containing protein n=1 Tax=Opacimonas viscosa TaxID=2961944 RepID=A0AA42BLD3_9ALTE|nr:XrtA system polysaccharide chain length determinant [Opacimonas viscosa]MCP3428484.1 Wzz/FepE/Etk N-terminal domain-containing protein [Opacimonas viscosa]
MQDLQQTINIALDYLRGIWIKKRFVIICTWIFCPIGFFYVASMPNVYESEAKVYVDTRSLLQPLLRGLALQTNPQTEIETMAKTLLSRSNVEEIARQADLDITATDDAAYTRLINELSNDIELKSTGRDNIYTIAYAHPNAEMAQTVVQETLDLFVEGSLGNNRRDTDTANRFLDEQIAEYESRLLESEQRLADFKRQYADILPQQGSFYDNLKTLNQQLESNQLQIRETEQQVNSLKGQLQPSSDGSTDNITIQTRFDSRIENLETRLDELLLRFTEIHPDVIETNTLLENLKASRQREIDAMVNSPSSDSSSMNLLTQEIRLEISRLESLMASLEVRAKDTQAKITALRSKIDLVPQVEAESTALNRDYGIMQQKYEELLNRRESAELSRRADVSSEDLQFRIIEPPLVPQKPSGPKRLIFYTAVLILGFGAGTGLAFLVSQFSPVLVRAHQLTTMTTYPILGSVTHIDIDNITKKNRFKIIVFSLSSGAILLMFIGLVGLEILNINPLA